MEFILDTHVLPENASARLIELKKDLLAHERKHTVLVLPDDLTEYLDKCSVECGESTNLMIFMFLQISLSCWWTKSNPQIFKGLDPKKVDNIFDETQNISIEFKYENDILKFDLIKKTKISPMTKTLAGLPVMGENTNTKKRRRYLVFLVLFLESDRSLINYFIMRLHKIITHFIGLRISATSVIVLRESQFQSQHLSLMD